MVPEIYIIILNWNGWQDTVECVESCRKLNYPNFRILIVDNGSTDCSEAILRERFPDIEIISTGENLGFAGGNNFGIKYVIKKGADYIWLLNNDTIVNAETLSALVEIANLDRKIGIVGSKIYYFDNPTKIWFAGGYINWDLGITEHFGIKEFDRGQYEVIKEVDFITGCSLLIKKEVIEKIGLMEEDYFLYYEDVEWCIRAQRAGYKTVYVPKSMLWHKVSASGGGTESPLVLYYNCRNSMFFYKRYLPTHKWMRLYMKLLRRYWGNIKGLLKHKPINIRKIAAIICAFRDYHLRKKRE